MRTENQNLENLLAESSEKIEGLESKIISAVMSGDFEMVFIALENINQALTGAQSISEGNAVMEESIKKDIIDFLERYQSGEKFFHSKEIYLGDGGHSRLILRVDIKGNPQCVLTDNSTVAMKEKWAKMK